MINGRVIAGPTGPPTIDQPDDASDVAPVEGAEIAVVSADGSVVDTVRSNNQGRFCLDLAIGRYELQPQPLAGYLGLPEPVVVTVRADEALNVEFMYDTGVR